MLQSSSTASRPNSSGRSEPPGGLPFEIRTAAPSELHHKCRPSRRPTRDLIVNDIEVAVEGALLDGMACLASCDKLMAAGRLNIPTIVVPCGYQRSGRYRGDHMDIEEVFLNAGHVTSGQVTVEELAEMSDDAIRSPGVCAGHGHRQLHAHCLRGPGYGAAGRRPRLGQQPEDDGLRAPGRRKGR